jgi:hypothetical protein
VELEGEPRMKTQDCRLVGGPLPQTCCAEADRPGQMEPPKSRAGKPPRKKTGALKGALGLVPVNTAGKKAALGAKKRKAMAKPGKAGTQHKAARLAAAMSDQRTYARAIKPAEPTALEALVRPGLRGTPSCHFIRLRKEPTVCRWRQRRWTRRCCRPSRLCGLATVTPASCSTRHTRRSLYDSTFSRTVWRLYGGAKGLVMWY